MSGTERETYIQAEYHRRADWHFDNAYDAIYESEDLAAAVRNFAAAALNYRLAGKFVAAQHCQNQADLYQRDMLSAETVSNHS